jgi:hypothetical protein
LLPGTYSAESLIDAEVDELEKQLLSAVRMVDEFAAPRSRGAGRGGEASIYRARITKLEAASALMGQLLKEKDRPSAIRAAVPGRFSPVGRRL